MRKPGIASLDSPEQIKACLSCTREECVNCLRRNYAESGKARGRPGRPIIAIKGSEWHIFHTVKDAAEAMGASQSAICGAIRRKNRCSRYYWRYV